MAERRPAGPPPQIMLSYWARGVGFWGVRFVGRGMGVEDSGSVVDVVMVDSVSVIVCRVSRYDVVEIFLDTSFVLRSLVNGIVTDSVLLVEGGMQKLLQKTLLRSRSANTGLVSISAIARQKGFRKKILDIMITNRCDVFSICLYLRRYARNA